MKSILALFALVVSLCFGGEKIITGTPDVNITSLSKALPWTAEFQVDISAGSGSSIIAANPIGLTVQNYSNFGVLNINIPWTTPTSTCAPAVTIGGSYYFRVVYNPVGVMTCEMWAASNGVYGGLTSVPWTVNSSYTFDSLGVDAATAGIGFFRIFDYAKTTGLRLPTIFDSDAGITHEYRFNNSLEDSDCSTGTCVSRSGGSPLTGAATYDTQSYDPVAIAALTVGGATPYVALPTLRVGSTNTLSTANSVLQADTTNVATTVLSQTAGTTGTITNASSATPLFTPAVRGQVTLRVTASGSGASDVTTDIVIGAVTTVNVTSWLVSYPDAKLDLFLGPQYAYGRGPYEWESARRLIIGDSFVDQYAPNGGTWRLESEESTINGVTRTGTISVSNGGTTITGSGTNFLDVYTGGSPGPVLGTYWIVGKIPPVAMDGSTPRPYMRLLDSCSSQTACSFASGWSWDRPSQSGIAWGSMGVCSDCGEWRTTQQVNNNLNFYDNGKSAYAMYYASGLTRYKLAGRFVADYWPLNPYEWIQFTPRDLGLDSAFIRYLVDTESPQSTNYWPLLAELIDGCDTFYTKNTLIGDPREWGYCMQYKATLTKYEPDAGDKIVRRAYLQDLYDWQVTQQTADGDYINSQFERNNPVVVVAQGSATVTWSSGSGAYAAGFAANTCGTALTEAGTISVGVDRVSVTGSSTNFTGASGKNIYITGLLNGSPWAMSDIVLSVADSTHLTLTYGWRGDPGSITDYRILITLNSAVPTSGGAPLVGDGFNTDIFFGVTSVSGVIPDPQQPDADTSYWCRRTDSTHLTLSMPYTHETAISGVYRSIFANNLTGRGGQSIFQGIDGNALERTAVTFDDYDTIRASGTRTYLGHLVDWLWDSALDPITLGFYYGWSDFSNCKSLIVPALYCSSTVTDSSSARGFITENNMAFGWRYLETHDATLRARILLLLQYQFAKDGYISPTPGDGYFASNIDSCCLNGTKSWGQPWGVGAAPMVEATIDSVEVNPGTMRRGAGRIRRGSGRN